MSTKRIAIWSLIVIAVAGGLLSVFSFAGGHPSNRINYPYICKDCNAVFDYKELKADDYRHWIVPKGASSGSIAVCLRCNKGWAYPVSTCEKCTTRHILHRAKDNRCPKCFPEAADVARKAGVNVLFGQP